MEQVEDNRDWRGAAIHLAMREADYRLNSRVHGAESIDAKKSLELMRQAGEHVRELAGLVPSQVTRDAPTETHLTALLDQAEEALEFPENLRVIVTAMATALQRLAELNGKDGATPSVAEAISDHKALLRDMDRREAALTAIRQERGK